jgi:Ni,Fe-hydrogenase III small subunit
MLLGLKKTYEAVPDPKLVIAAGACAISGRPFIDHPEIHNGVGSISPVALLCPRLSASPNH